MFKSEGLYPVSGGGGILCVAIITYVGSLLGSIFGSSKGCWDWDHIFLALGKTNMKPLGSSSGSVDGIRLWEELVMRYGNIWGIRRDESEGH